MSTALNDDLTIEDPEQAYLPSPERIRRLTAAIRRRWSNREYIKRSARKPRRWTLSEVSVCLDASEYSDA